MNFTESSCKWQVDEAMQRHVNLRLPVDAYALEPHVQMEYIPANMVLLYRIFIFSTLNLIPRNSFMKPDYT